MRILSAMTVAVGVAGPALAQAPMTLSVMPRDVAWYMAHPEILRRTLKVCQSNAAYQALPDCTNAEGAGAGLMGRRYEGAVRSDKSLNLNDPAYWSTNPIAREGVLAQCRRRAPGDELAFPYCSIAAASKIDDLKRH